MQDLDFSKTNTSNNNELMPNDLSVVDTNNSDPLKSVSAQKENFKKPSKKINYLTQLILVGLMCSILGGVISGGVLPFVTSKIHPAANSIDKQQLASSGINKGQGIPLGDDSSFKLSSKNEIDKKLSASSNLSAEDSNAGNKEPGATQDDNSSLITTIAEKVSPSVVGIRCTFMEQDIFGQSRQSSDEGSGIIIKSDGNIMTNFHVIESAVDKSTNKIADGGKIEVFFPNRKDTAYTAQIIGYDEKTDLAVIKVDVADLPVAELGNSDEVKVGELAVAIGNPGGLEYMGSVTSGIISGLNRTVDLSNGSGFKLIQTDAAINPGNSGGALVNGKGQVIGINSVKIVAQGFEGLGFAIPINKAKEITDSLMKYTYVKGRPELGIQVDPRYTEQVAAQNKLPAGVYVSDVTILSGAFRAGIQANDIITKFNRVAIKNFDDLSAEMDKHKAGDTVAIVVYRITDQKANTGKIVLLKVVLGEAK
jgi:serine protease Do